MTTKILEQIQADIRALGGRMDGLSERLDAHESRFAAIEYTIRGMAADVRLIPEILQVVRRTAELVEDHDRRLDRLES